MIVLDTHILIWLVSDDTRLSLNARARIDSAIQSGEQVLISSITAWEVAMLVTKERLSLAMDLDTWLQTVSDIEGLQFVAIDNKVAIESTRLPGEFHKDPADRMIVALTRVLSATLITADEKILNYEHVRTIN